MKTQKLMINNIKCIIYGEDSDKVFLFFHGKMGSKEDGKFYADILTQKGYQLLSFDFPRHGERTNSVEDFVPWQTTIDIKNIFSYSKSKWTNIYIICNSIGAYFAMLALKNEDIKFSLFISPIVDMELLIKNMMIYSNVDIKTLKEKQTINTNFGETLDYNYYLYAKDNEIVWNKKTSILFAENDNLTSFKTITNFCKKFNSKLEIMKNGEHWFHTKQQIDFLTLWFNKEIENI